MLERDNDLGDGVAPPDLARHAVSLIQGLMGARSAGLFARDDHGQRLIYGDGLRQAGLDIMSGMWPDPPPSLRRGLPFGDTNPGTSVPFVVLPCVVCGDLRGLLYVERPSAPKLRSARVQALNDVLGDVLRAGLQVPRPAIGDDPAAGRQDLDAFQLQSVLEQAEWNISRASRVLGFTRMTLYNRMRRLQIKRVKPPKSRSQRAAS